VAGASEKRVVLAAWKALGRRVRGIAAVAGEEGVDGEGFRAVTVMAVAEGMVIARL